MNRSRCWSRSNGYCFIIVASMILVPMTAYAEWAVETEVLRSWPSPLSVTEVEVDSSVDGITLMMDAGQAAPVSDGCSVTISDDDKAQHYEYRHDFNPTRCLDAVAHPEGGYFLRGDVGATLEDVGEGFTARISADGELLWAVDDRQWIEPDVTQTSSGEFVGDYAGAQTGLAYDPVSDRLIGLTRGNQVLADAERLVVQAHVIRGDTGSVEVVGQAFGALANEPVIDVVARDGAFLVITTAGEQQEVRFYSYEVGRSMTRFEPEEAGWSQREIITPVAYRQSLGTFYLWSDGTASGLIRVEGLDSVIWSEQYAIDELVQGDITVDGEPEQSWLGGSLVALRFGSPAQGRFLILIDVEDGVALAMTHWEDLVEPEPIDLVHNEDGELMLLAFDPAEEVIREYQITLVPQDDEDEQVGAAVDEEDGAISDDDGEPNEENEESRCQQSTGGPAGLLAVGLLFLWCFRFALVDCVIYRGRLK